jgi:formylglycine-generating enzyme required for sulfatase activity
MLGTIAGLLGVIFKDEISTLWFEQTTLRRYIATNFTPYVRTAAAERAFRPGDTFQECAKDCPEMVVIPPGEFWMGSRDGEGDEDGSECPRHKVKIDKPFAVGKFEVTWDEWEACVATRGCDGRSTSDGGYGKGRRPVIDVSRDEANAYVAWLSRMTGNKPYRLLTEAEWEYAARGVTSADAPHPPYPWGDKASHEYANYGKDSTDRGGTGGKSEGRDEWITTAPVGQFPPNAFGLHDMHGNVWEWVLACRLSRNAAHRWQRLDRRWRCKFGCRPWRFLVRQCRLAPLGLPLLVALPRSEHQLGPPGRPHAYLRSRCDHSRTGRALSVHDGPWKPRRVEIEPRGTSRNHGGFPCDSCWCRGSRSQT